FNRGPEPAPLHVLPHLWCRNTWAWGRTRGHEPTIRPGPEGPDFLSLVTDDSAVATLSHIPVQYRLGRRTLYSAAGGVLLFTDNEPNMPRVFGRGHSNLRPYVKDAFHRLIVGGERCTNPAQVGTKAAIHYVFPAIAPGGSVVLLLRLSDEGNASQP